MHVHPGHGYAPISKHSEKNLFGEHVFAKFTLLYRPEEASMALGLTCAIN
jgi:hypothetical protein